MGVPLKDDEILTAAKQSYERFTFDYLIDCKVKVLNLKDFQVIAKKSSLVKKLIENKMIKNIKQLMIPALVVETDRQRLFISKAIINKLSINLSKEKKIMFVQGVVLHELYHVMFKDNRTLNIYGFLRSEKRADHEFRTDYPELAKVLDEVKKRYV